MNITASEDVKKFIRAKEGFTSTAYDDRGAPAIGYGLRDDVPGLDKSKPITQEVAEDLFQKRVNSGVDELNALITNPNMTQGQKDVFVDMQYNMGTPAMRQMIDRVNAGKMKEAGEAILLYNKSTNPKTKQKEVLASLVKRSQERYAMWHQASLPTQTAELQSGSVPEMVGTVNTTKSAPQDNSDESFYAAADAMVKEQESPDADFYAAADQFVEEDAMAAESDSKLEALQSSSNSIDESEINKKKEAMQIAKATGRRVEDVEADLLDKPGKYVMADSKQELTARYFPKTAEWAGKDPANYYMMAETGDWARHVEVAAKAFSPEQRSNWEKTLRSNPIPLEIAKVQFQMVNGLISRGEAKLRLRDLEQKQNENQLSGRSARLAQEALGKFEVLNPSTWGQFFDTTFKHPESMAQVAGSSFASSVVPMVASLPAGAAGAYAGGMAGAMTGMPLVAAGGMIVGGAAASYTAAAGTAALISFGNYINEQAAEFKDPETGLIDWDKALADEDRLKQWVKEAKVYAGIMGASEGFYSLVVGKAGNKVVKHLAGKAGTSAVKKVGAKVAGVAAESLVEMGEEFVGELAGTSGADAVGGRLTAEKFKSNINKAGQEAIISPGTGAFMGSIGMATKGTIGSVRQAAVIVTAKIQDSNKANTDLANLSTLRAKIEGDPKAQENPEAVEDLVNTVLKPEEKQESEYAPLSNDDDESLIPDEKKIMAKEAYGDTVSVAPSDWFEYHGNNISKLDNVPMEIKEQFLDNRATDKSVVIPAAVWFSITMDDPKIDNLVRVGKNQLNGVEANEDADSLENLTLEELIAYHGTNANFDTFSSGKIGMGENNKLNDMDYDGSDVVDPDSPIEIIEPTEADKNIVSRPVYLTQKGRSQKMQKIFIDLTSRIKASNKEFEPEYVEKFAEFQLRHIVGRAEVLGVPVEQIANRLQIGSIPKKEASKVDKNGNIKWRLHGQFSPNLRSDGVFKITFSKTANVKTLVHEFGHMFLHEMYEDYDFIMAIPEEKLTFKQAEYKNAMLTAEKYLGFQERGWKLNQLTSQESLSTIVTVYDGKPRSFYQWVHERFSQTTEHYFLDGKFDNEAKGLLDAFRGYVVRLATNIRELTYKWARPLPINKDIERMFDSILNLNDKVEDATVPMFDNPLFDWKMLGPDGPKYREKVADARSHVIGAAIFKSITKSYREREKAINAAMDDVYKKAIETVDSRTSMLFLKGFEDAYKEFKEGKLPSDPRINFESFARMFANGDETAASLLKEKLPKVLVAGKKKGGIDIAQLMFINDINDPKVMLDMMLEMGQREKMIEAEADKIIEKDFPIMKSDEEIHQAAVEAVSNDGKEKLLMAEMKLLATKFLPTLKGIAGKLINPVQYLEKSSKIIMANEGNHLVMTDSAYRFSAYRFLVESNRFARQASKAFEANNVEGALEFKRMQAVRYFAYRIAQDAEEQIAKTRLSIKNMVRYSRSKDFGNDFDADIMAFGRQVLIAANSVGEIPTFNLKSLSHYSGAHQGHVDQINGAIKRFVEVSNGLRGDKQSVQGYLAFGDVVRSITKAAKDAKKVEMAGKTFDRQAISNQTVNEIKAGKNVIQFSSARSGTMWKRAIVDTRSLFDSMYSSSEAFAKSALGMLYQTVMEAEATRNLAFDIKRERIANAVKKAVGVDKSLKGILAPLVYRGSLKRISISDTSKPIIAPELGMNFNNLSEVWYAYLLVEGSESGAQKFLEGYGISTIHPETQKMDRTKWDAFKKRMEDEGIITEKHYEMFQEIWDTFKDVHPLVKDAMRKSDGFIMGEITGRNFTAFGKEYTGGYVPVADVMELTRKPSLEESAKDPDLFGYKAHDLYPHMRTGMTEQRNNSAYQVDLDMGKLTSYLSATMNIAHLRNPMLEFGKIIDDPAVRDALEERRPGAYREIILPWFDAVKKQTFTEPSKRVWDITARELRKGTNTTLYVLNFLTAAKQFLGFFPVMSKVSPVRLANVIARQMAAPKKTRADILEKSVVMRDRVAKSIETMTRSWEQLETNFDWVSWTEPKANALTYFHIQFMQNIVDFAAWQTAYEQGIEKNGMTEKQAIFFADSVVKTTQSSGAVSDMSNFQRGTDLTKLFTSVTSVDVAINRLLRVETMRDAEASNKAIAITKIAVLSLSAPLIVRQLIKAMAAELGDEEEEEEEEKGLSIMEEMAMAGLDNSLPGIGRFATSSYQFGTMSFSPGLNKVKQLPKATKAVYHKLNDVPMSTEDIVALMDSMTLITGGSMPFSAIGRLAKGYDATMVDQDELDQEAEGRDDLLQNFRDEQDAEE